MKKKTIIIIGVIALIGVNTLDRPCSSGALYFLSFEA